MKLLAATTLVVLGLAGCGGPRAAGDGAAETTPDADTRLARAGAASQAGEYDAALRLFREVLAADPTSVPAYVGVGEIYLDRKDYGRAEPVFARAARLAPRDFDAQYGHGVALQMLNRLVEAAEAYHRALTIRPRSVKANRHLATTYLQLDEASSALVFAEKAVEVAPADGVARANLGTVYWHLGRNAEAIREYEAAIELMEPTPQLLLNLVGVLNAAGRHVDAKNTAEYLVRIAPSSEAWERLGWTSFRSGDFERSLEAYRESARLDPGNWRALNGVGCNALNRWLLSGKHDGEAVREARRALRRSLQINPDQQKVISLLSRYGN